MSFIGGRVTFDADLDNTENASGGGFDAGIEGVVVQLLNLSGQVIGTTTTDANGAYSFSGLANGSYAIRFPTAIGNAELAQDSVGGDPDDDSDAFSNGETIYYQVPQSGAEDLTQIDASYGFYSGGGPNGVVDGDNSGEFMAVGYRDDDFDQITEGNDVIFGNGGNDDIRAGGGDDFVSGGTENDFIDGGAGNDNLNGDEGNDDIRGGDGEDGLFGGAGDDFLDGGADDDLIAGGSGNDDLRGGDGNDNMFGEDGNDFIDGGTGDDTVVGGDGADDLRGGDGNDSIYGGADSDFVEGGDGNDLIAGGDTADSFVYFQNFNDGTLNGWQLDDPVDGTLTASGTAGVGGSGGLVFDDAQSDLEFLRAPQDFLDAFPSSGDLTDATLSFDVQYSTETAFNPAATITITGDGQTITLPYTLESGQAGNFQTVTVDLLDATAAGVTEVRLQEILANITDLQIAIDYNTDFPAGDEVFVDNIGLSITTAGADNDTLEGGAGDDTLLGEDGDDSLSGGDGADTIYGDDSTVFVYNTPSGQLFSYDPVTGTSTELTSGLLTYGDIATTPDGTLYGVVLNASDGSTNAGIYQIDPVTGSETLVYDVPDNAQFFSGLTSDPDGNLYVTDLNALTVTRIEPDGFGGFTNPTVVLNFTGLPTDIAFVDGNTAWVVYDNSTVEAYDVDGSGNFTNPTSLGSIPGGGNLSGIDVADNGLIYVTNLAGDVFSTDPSSLPPTWTAEPGTGETIYGAAAVPAGLSTPGNDTIDGGTGNDTIVAGDGSDTIQLFDNFGDDVIFGGEDPDGLDVDVIDASGITTGGVTVNVTNEDGSIVQGPDSADFSDIESFVLTDQDDTFNAFGTSDVTVDAGGGDDEITEGSGNNVIDGGTGSDTFNVGIGTSTITGGEDGDGSDVDILSAFDANDGITVTFDGTEQGTYTDNSDSDSGTFSQIEAIEGSNQADTINAAADNSSGLTLSGFDGDDSITGGSGDDIILGGSGSDTLDGGAGSDTLDGGAGVDTLTGGAGPDVFAADGTGDLITDFDPTTGIADDGSANNDFVNLSAYYNETTLAAWNAANPGNTFNDPLSWMRADQADGTLDEAGGLRIQNSGSSVDGAQLNAENTGVVCFTSGTLIATPHGEVPIETLKPGDLVLTRDNGPQPLVWIGHRHVTGAELAREEKLRPIEIKPHLINSDKSLIVSRQHGVLLNVDGEETLVRAIHLTKLPGAGARIMRGCREVTYIHLMFEEHQIIFAGGAPSESFHPGPQALAALNLEARTELFDLFPELPSKLSRDFAHYSQLRDACLSLA